MHKTVWLITIFTLFLGCASVQNNVSLSYSFSISIDENISIVNIYNNIRTYRDNNTQIDNLVLSKNGVVTGDIRTFYSDISVVITTDIISSQIIIFKENNELKIEIKDPIIIRYFSTRPARRSALNDRDIFVERIIPIYTNYINIAMKTVLERLIEQRIERQSAYDEELF